MGVVFIVLVALAITSSTMSWLDASETVRNIARKLNRNKSEAPAVVQSGMKAAPSPSQDKSRPSGPSGEVIAAITVALALARRSTGRLLPATPAAATGQSAWAAAGRRRAMERASKVDR
ncbi:MAG: OadG family protein [Chloroflexi bacterium]|nr:OadG family protein [Chloroflexota bacterium]MCH8223522.1 OadG family protein [Chloroflexota bacterium]